MRCSGIYALLLLLSLRADYDVAHLNQKPLYCTHVYVPIPFANMTVHCVSSSNQEPNQNLLVGDIISIDLFDQHNNRIRVENLLESQRVIMFIPVYEEFEKLTDLECVWISELNEISSTGCKLVAELGNKNSEGITGRFCSSNHLSSFSVARKPAATSAKKRNVRYQYVNLVIAIVILLSASTQGSRAWLALRAFSLVVVVHFAVSIGVSIMILIYLFAPLLETSTLAVLASLVTSIQLICYECLVYAWTSPMIVGQRINKLKRMLVTVVGLTIIINSGIPLAMFFVQETHINNMLFTISRYIMTSYVICICVFLAYRGLCLRQRLLIISTSQSRTPRTQPINHEACVSLTTRIAVGSIGLSISMIMQALFWLFSLNSNSFREFIYSETGNTVIGFGVPSFVTFTTLIFLFWFKVDEVVHSTQQTYSRSADYISVNAARQHQEIETALVLQETSTNDSVVFNPNRRHSETSFQAT